MCAKPSSVQNEAHMGKQRRVHASSPCHRVLAQNSEDLENSKFKLDSPSCSKSILRIIHSPLLLGTRNPALAPSPEVWAQHRVASPQNTFLKLQGSKMRPRDLAAASGMARDLGTQPLGHILYKGNCFFSSLSSLFFGLELGHSAEGPAITKKTRQHCGRVNNKNEGTRVPERPHRPEPPKPPTNSKP